MSYYANVTDSDFCVPADKLDEAFKALCALNSHEEMNDRHLWSSEPIGKPADSTSVASRPDFSFGHMDWDYDVRCDSVQDVLSELGFDCETGDYGVSIGEFSGSYSGDEPRFLSVLAAFVKPHSYIEFHGEDGESWREVVTESHSLREVQPIWPEE